MWKFVRDGAIDSPMIVILQRKSGITALGLFRFPYMDGRPSRACELQHIHSLQSFHDFRSL